MLKETVALSLAVLAVSPLWAIHGTIRTELDKKTGDIKWQPRAKKYELSFKNGKTTMSAEYPLADVVSLDIAKPETFDKAVQLVEKGQGASAIATLQEIMTDYRMLVWDKAAGRYLVLAYLANNQADKALDVCQSVISEDKTAEWSGDLAPAYWQALLKTGKTEKLENILKKAASSGSRSAAAAAAVMRGDIIMAEGDAPEVTKRALRDGYLKVALMYTDKDCVRERSEAMMKAAACFDKIGQAARAEKLRQQARAM